jgi:KDO2-lipid IV(A) lauroyltransferase
MFSIWVRARFVVEAWLLHAAVVVIPWLPHGLLKLVAQGLGAFASLVDYRGRAAAWANLTLLFPNLPLREIKRLRRRSYQIFARAFAELFWSRHLTPQTVDRFATAHLASDATKLAMQEGCIFATLHAGNFEWLSRATALWGYPSMIVAANFLNHRLTPIFQALRQVEGHQIIPQEHAILKLFKHLKRGGRTAMLIDLNVPPDQSATIISCFGKLTCVTQAHAALAQRTGRPLVPAISLPQADGRYAMRFLDPIPVGPADSLTDITQRCWDQFEPFIREQPEIWMWMYKHWRYLPEGATTAEYPAYANHSKKFEKLRKAMGLKDASP